MSAGDGEPIGRRRNLRKQSDLEGRNVSKSGRGVSPDGRGRVVSVSPTGACRQGLLPLQRTGGGGKSTAPSRTRWEGAEGHSTLDADKRSSVRRCGKDSIDASHTPTAVKLRRTLRVVAPGRALVHMMSKFRYRI